MLGGIIGAAAGAAGGILGGISKNKALKQQMKMVNEQKKENQDWYDRRYNEDSTQRADAQAMLTKTAEAIKQRNQASAGSAAVMGGTEESVASTKAANAQAMADATSNIVVAGEQRKDQIESQYRERNNELNQQLQNLQSQKKDALSITSDAIGGAVNGFAKGSGLG
jgi:hypothetical protein